MPSDEPDHSPGLAGAAAGLARDLERWRPADARVDEWRVECLSLLRTHDGDVLDRARRREHVTASCFVFSPDLEHVLLTLHRKLGLWLQLGGHVEPGDRSVVESARREAREESGIADLDLATHLPADLERQDVGHALTGCSVHWDLGYVAIVDRTAPVTASVESHLVQWWHTDRLPPEVPATLHLRIARAARSAARSLRG